MRKAILKRIKMTKTGRILHRKRGQNHFNAKTPRRVQRRQKQMKEFPAKIEKKIKAHL